MNNECDSWTIERFIEELKKYPQTAMVNITWEGTTSPICEENMYMSKRGWLMLDADENFYKDRYQKGS